MGTNYYAVETKPTIRTPIHIGKSSIGWRFLFYRLKDYENHITNKPLNTFPQWKEFLETQTKAGTIVIMNEYNEIVELERLLNLINEKQTENHEDNFKYGIDDIDGYRFSDDDFS